MADKEKNKRRAPERGESRSRRTRTETSRREAAEREARRERSKKAAADQSRKTDAEQKRRAAQEDKARQKALAQERKARLAAEKQAAAQQRSEERRERAVQRKAAFRLFLRRVRTALLVLLALIVLLAAAATAGGYFVSRSETNGPGVFLDGVDVSGLTRGQTIVKLGESGWDENAELPLTVLLPAEMSFQVDLLDSGAMLPKDVAADAAFRYGHSPNWYINLYRYLKGLVLQTDVSQSYGRLDSSYIQRSVNAAVDAFERETDVEPYQVDTENEELRMLKGAGAMTIDRGVLAGEVEAALKAQRTEVDHRHIDNELSAPDFEGLYKQLHVEPVDAYYADDKFNVVDEIVGVTFDVAQARMLWDAAAAAEEVTIPIDVTYPENTGEKLRGMLFRDILGKQTTLFGGSTPERMNNIRLAAQKLHEVILYPGETFSYNDTVGERTREAGFQEAGAYQDGEVVQEVGGGICQVSSTLYCAAVFANMETVEREAHYFLVNYLPRAHDATVSWPKPDFKFKNTRDYPVMIKAWTDTEEALDLTIEIWGTDVDGSYVELEYESYMIFDEVYTDLVVGWHVYSHRNIFDRDGNLIATVDEPDGIYHKHDYEIPWPAEHEGES